jgi:hypothetical protein
MPLLARCATFFLLLVSAFPARAQLSPEDARLSAEARGVLAHQCTKCHGQQKQKGELRLDTKANAMKGGESGVAIVPGKPLESALLKRISLPTADDDHMPPEKILEPGDLETLRKWIAAGAPWPEGETAGIVFQRAPIAPRKPVFPAGTESFENPIDKFVAAYFAGRKTDWPEPVDQRTFLKRASLDLIGLLPTWPEMQAFDGDRAKAVDALLAREEDYATHWLTFWNDALRNDYAGTGYIDGGRRQISKWLYRALAKDMPYDQFVRELVAPTRESDGFIRGIKWRGNVSAGQRVELQAAQNVAQVFLGLNLKCASCHDSFINDYKLTDAHALGAVFADAPLEVFRCDKSTGEKTAPAFFWPELGTVDPAKPRPERQKELAALLTKRENGRLARTFVNRLWAACFGRGLVEPLDVMDNTAWSPDLLDWLAADFAENGYRVKRTLRLILTSRTYCLPSVSVGSADDLTKTSFVFGGPVVRRMNAEQFTDAVARVAAPLYTKREFIPGRDDGGLAKSAAWIWHDEGEIPLDQFTEGKRYFRTSFQLPPGKKVKTARVVATADNTFTLYVNGHKTLSGKNWEGAESANITNALDRESITLAVVADNVAPGAAGLRLALGIWFEGQKAPMVVETSTGWRSSARAAKDWETPQFDDSSWTSAMALGPEGLPWGPLRGFTLVEEPPIVRAALVQNDEVQNVLGRPIRDQITMERPTQATLLQALTLTNGKAFAAAIDRGAKEWAQKQPDPTKRLTNIYRTALLREPRPDELSFAKADPADVLWALVLQPEFQLIQ